MNTIPATLSLPAGLSSNAEYTGDGTDDNSIPVETGRTGLSEAAPFSRIEACGKCA